MFKKLLLASILAGSMNVLAHEGHDQTPGALKAIHGGTVKPGKELNLEYVVSGTEVKLYPVSHEAKDVSAAEVKLTGTATLPKGKATPAKIEFKDGVYVTNVDFKSAYRVEMNVTAETNGKKSTFKFQVEK